MGVRAIVLLLLVVRVFTVHGEDGTSGTVVKFDGNRAYDHLLAQVALGPRPPGSVALEQTRQYILAELGKQGFTTGTQAFDGYSEVENRTFPCKNIFGYYSPSGAIKYCFSAHYDCRPIADRDPDPSRRTQPIIGANDGASGVAVLLEMARVIRESKPQCGVALVFFDLEDSGLSTEGFCVGSRYMANNPVAAIDFEYGVNLDMVGDADLRLPREGYSLARSSELCNRIWEIGQRLYPSIFVMDPGPRVYDDHMPFLERGKKYVDVIDFEYPQWHTQTDTADKCSPLSLAAVGQVVAELLRY